MDVSKWPVLLFAGIMLYCGHSANGGQWIINIQTADIWMAGYVGDVTICLSFKSPNIIENSTTDPKNSISDNLKKHFVKEDCQVLPRRHFERGKSYNFSISYAEDSALEKVRILAKPLNSSFCKQKSEDAWHIEDITFQNLVTGQLFQQRTTTMQSSRGGLIVKTKCGNQNKEIILDSFNKSVQPRPCPWRDGVIYKNGERFEDGCSGICSCKDGGVSCVSRCPPHFAVDCRLVYIPDQCCPQFICEETNQLISCPLYEASDCETSDRTVEPGENPWIAFIKFCKQNNSCNRFCSGALLNEHWVITAAECFPKDENQSVLVNQVRVIIGEHTLILAEDSDVEIAVEKITMSPSNTGRIALIKLKESVSFDHTVQPVILPLNKDQCLQLVQPYCALSLTGWINIGASEAEQYELYKLTARIEHSNTCGPPIIPTEQSSHTRKRPSPSRYKDSSICVDFGTTDSAFQSECGACQDFESESCHSDKNVYLCSGERGRTLISKVQVPSAGKGHFEEVNYIVGIISYQLSANESAAGLCKKSAYRLAVNICQELNWIRTTINAN